MPHIQVEATTEQLLGAVAQLPADELATFVERVLMLRAERAAPHLPADETALLLRINQPVPESVQHRFDALVARRREGTLTTEEHAELLRCQGCNNHKYDKVAARDPISGVMIPLFHPRQRAWADDFRWSDDYALIIGVTAVGRATVAALDLNRDGLVNLRRALFAIGEHPPPS